MHTPTAIRRRLLAGLGAASLALIAAAPADAAYRSYEGPDGDAPVIERTVEKDDTGTGQKGCTIDVKGPDGNVQSSITYPHGYSFKAINKATGKTHTYTCNNGTWEETVSASSTYAEYTYDAQYNSLEAQP